MAFQKSIVCDKGIATNYHKISSVLVDNVDTTYLVKVYVASFVDKSYRNESMMNRVTLNSYGFVIDKANANKDIVTLAYEYLKTTDTFKDAIDV